MVGRAEPAQVANVKRAVPSSRARRIASSTRYRYASDKQCPVCGGRLIRTPRRLQDRLWSMAEPVMRFRCDRFSCQWVGNISGRGGAKRLARAAGSSRLLPGATLVALLLVGVGLVTLALFATTDVFESAAVRSTAMPSSEWVDLTRRLNAGSGPLFEPVQPSAQPVVPQIRR